MPMSRARVVEGILSDQPGDPEPVQLRLYIISDRHEHEMNALLLQDAVAGAQGGSGREAHVFDDFFIRYGRRIFAVDP